MISAGLIGYVLGSSVAWLTQSLILAIVLTIPLTLFIVVATYDWRQEHLGW